MVDLVPLNMLPGISNDDSDLASKGMYVDGKNVRFVKGQFQKIGGHVTLHDGGVIFGAPRASISWIAVDGTKLSAYGSSKGLYLIYDGVEYDITPPLYEDVITNPFVWTQGSSVVRVNMTGHGRETGDIVSIFGNLTAGGVTVNGNYEITKLTDDAFTIDTGQVVGIVIGLNYGTGQYEVTAYGGAPQDVIIRRPIASGLDIVGPNGEYPRIWSLDSWGDNLVAAYYGSTIFEWSFVDGPGIAAYPLPNAPEMVGTIFVSEDDRILHALGATGLDGIFDPLLDRWSDQENNTVWIPLEDNFAGDKRLEVGSAAVGSEKTVSGRLLLTDNAAYTMRYVGQPYIYAIEFVESGCGLVAPHAIGKIDSIVYWMGSSKFFRFDGVVSEVPCSVHTFLFGDSTAFGDISTRQRLLTSAGKIERYREIVFSYSNDDDSDVNRTVTLTEENGSYIWSLGDVARSTFFDNKEYFEYPIGAGTDGIIYAHEFGDDADGDPLEYRLRSGDFDLSNGSLYVMMVRFMFDWKKIIGTHRIRLLVKESPQGESYWTDYETFDSTTEWIDFRERGRSIAFELSSVGLASSMRSGVIRMGANARGVKS